MYYTIHPNCEKRILDYIPAGHNDRSWYRVIVSVSQGLKQLRDGRIVDDLYHETFIAKNIHFDYKTRQWIGVKEQVEAHLISKNGYVRPWTLWSLEIPS